jgi:hypothetical protein
MHDQQNKTKEHIIIADWQQLYKIRIFSAGREEFLSSLSVTCRLTIL